MNAPLIEIVIRLIVAIAATAATLLMAMALKHARRDPRATPVPLLMFFTGILFISAVWRWFIFWLGFQNDLGHWGWVIPWIQPMNGVMILLIYVAVLLIGYYHRNVRKEREAAIAALSVPLEGGRP
jgi:hypothetical protein